MIAQKCSWSCHPIAISSNKFSVSLLFEPWIGGTKQNVKKSNWPCFTAAPWMRSEEQELVEMVVVEKEGNVRLKGIQTTCPPLVPTQRWFGETPMVEIAAEIDGGWESGAPALKRELLEIQVKFKKELLSYGSTTTKTESKAGERHIHYARGQDLKWKGGTRGVKHTTHQWNGFGLQTTRIPIQFHP